MQSPPLLVGHAFEDSLANLVVVRVNKLLILRTDQSDEPLTAHVRDG